MIRPCPDHEGEDCPRCADEWWWPVLAGASLSVSGLLLLPVLVSVWLTFR